MGLNLDLVGRKTKTIPITYTEKDVIIYALGIGAGIGELDFIYEKNLKVFPTYALILAYPAGVLATHDVGLNFVHVVHGEQKTVLHKPIPPSGTVYCTAVLSAIYDKGDMGAALPVDIEVRDDKGELISESRSVAIDRSAGNFGGDRGPKAEIYKPPEGKSPDFHVEYTTSPEQAAIYRLNGDLNPLHIEPAFAEKAGVGRPILHGLCTYGFTGRAILHNVCGSDPARFKSFTARFMNMVYPGDKLYVDGWDIGQGKYVILTKNMDGKVVLGNAVAEIA